MNYRVDHSLTDKQRFFVRYSRNNRVENRGNWTGEIERHQADRQLPLPHQRRAQRRSRLDDVELVAAERAGELVALPGAEHPPEPGHLRSGQPRLSRRPPRSTSAATCTSRASRWTTRRRSAISATRSPAAPTRTSTRSSRPGRLFRGKHSFRSGVDFRVYREESFPSVHSAGRYDFARGERADAAARQLAGRGDRPGPGRHAARATRAAARSTAAPIASIR